MNVPNVERVVAHSLARSIHAQCQSFLFHFQSDEAIDMAHIYDRLCSLGYNARFFYSVAESHTVIDDIYTEEELPSDGKYVPYLFGTKNRPDLIDSIGWSIDGAADGRKYLGYFDGRILKEVSADDARAVVAAYRKVTL